MPLTQSEVCYDITYEDQQENFKEMCNFSFLLFSFKSIDC